MLKLFNASFDYFVALTVLTREKSNKTFLTVRLSIAHFFRRGSPSSKSQKSTPRIFTATAPPTIKQLPGSFDGVCKICARRERLALRNRGFDNIVSVPWGTNFMICYERPR